MDAARLKTPSMPATEVPKVFVAVTSKAETSVVLLFIETATRWLPRFTVRRVKVTVLMF